MGNGNGDAGSSYTPAKATYPPIETHKRRGEESGFPCTDSFLFVAVVFCCCLLLVSMQRDLCDLYDRITGAALHQQTRIHLLGRGAQHSGLLPHSSLSVPPLAPCKRKRERERVCVEE